MAYLNANVPPIECYVRGNYLRNQEDSFYPLFIEPQNGKIYNLTAEEFNSIWTVYI